MTDFVKYDDFARVEMKVARVLSCEKAENADKLLVFTLGLGGSETRQVVSSIADFYQPIDLIGKQVVCITNFKPRKLRGNTSEGMLLTGEDEKANIVSLLTVLSEVPDGASIH